MGGDRGSWGVCEMFEGLSGTEVMMMMIMEEEDEEEGEEDDDDDDDDIDE